MEQRLLETEIALFETLLVANKFHYGNDDTQLETEIPRILSDLSTQQSKEAKLEEWKRLPLRTAGQRRDWWQHLLNISKIRNLKNTPEVETSPPLTDNTWGSSDIARQSSQLNLPAEIQEQAGRLVNSSDSVEPTHSHPAAEPWVQMSRHPESSSTSPAADVERGAGAAYTRDSADGSQYIDSPENYKRIPKVQWQKYF